MGIELLDGFRLGDLEIEPALGVVEGPGGSHNLRAQTMEMLVYLAQRPRELTSVDELAKAISDDGDSAVVDVESHLSELKTALTPSDGRQSYLVRPESDSVQLAVAVRPLYVDRKNGGLARLWREAQRREVVRVSVAYWVLVWALLQSADFIIGLIPDIPPWSLKFLVVLAFVGYPIVVAAAWVYRWTPDGVVIDSVNEGTRSGNKLRRSDFVIVAAALVALTVFLFDPQRQHDAIETDNSPTTIAVLPFDNLTGDERDQNLADGIVEELLNELVRLKELRVVGRKAAFYYRNSDHDWATLSEKLGASVLIEGSIRRNVDTFRVTAQAIDSTGYHLWSETYDIPIGSALDILAVQRRIALQVASALPVQLSDQSQIALQRTPTEDEQAYQLYISARNYLRIGDKMQDLESATQLFRDALELDPDFVDARAGLCETQNQLFQRTQRPEDYASAAATCSRLVTEDRLNPEGYVALGALNRFSGNHEEALTAYETALSISPDYEPALYGMARSVESLGRYEEAEQYYQRSEEVDPGFWQVYIGYGTYLERGGRVLEGIEKYKRALRLAPDNLAAYTNLGSAYLDLDRWDEAKAAFQSAIAIVPDPIAYMNLGTVEYQLGNLEIAESHFRAGIELWDRFYPLWGKLAVVLERTGRTGEAMEAFSTAEELARAVAAVNPNDARAKYYLASYLAHLGQLEAARAQADEAIRIAPADSSARYFSAIVASLAGNEDKAIEELARALELGYSVRIATNDLYFKDYLDSAELSEWMSEQDL